MDVSKIQIMIQMQAMSMLGRRSEDAFSRGRGENTFQSLLEDVMMQAINVERPSTSRVVNQQVPSSHFPVVQQLPSVVPEVSEGKGGVDHLIQKAAEHYGIDEKLVRSVVKAESNFDADVVSHAGAQGLMQLMPATAEGLGVSNPFDPEQNLMGGTKYLKQMLDRYDGDQKLALAAYNAGPGNVDKYGGVPPFRETQNYITKILG